MWRWLALVLLGWGFQTAAPEFSLWVECIERGPYPGRAVANISYLYAGEFPILAEDSRMFGDTSTGQTIIGSFSIQPGEHLRDTRINVGALKVVTWKVILFGQVHVVTVWDDPEIQDCPLDLPPPEATEAPSI